MSDPWFIMYRSRGHRRVVANSAKGGILIGAFVLAMTLPAVSIAILQELWLLWLIVPWMILSLVVFLRLVFAHSEVVPLDDAVALWREQQRRGGRR